MLHTDFSHKDGGVQTDFSMTLVCCTQILLLCGVVCTDFSHKDGVVDTDFSYKNGVVHTDFSCKHGGLHKISLTKMVWCTQIFLQ